MKNVIKSLLVVTAVFFTISCEIGLGSAVDTEVPEISITSPETDAVIRDAFAIKGSWSDDGNITGVTVTLKRTDGYGTSQSFDAKVLSDGIGKGTWSVVIDPKTDGIVDGSYEASIVISDEVGHDVLRTKTFIIDNTPPVVVLTRPGTKVTEPLEDPDAYGQTFTLEGSAYDDNEIDLVEVKIYSDKELTNLLNTVSLTDVPKTIDLDVAKFNADDIESDYSKIYGSVNKEGTKNFYCTITAYDEAKRYPVEEGESQSESDLKGNSISYYYLDDDVHTSLITPYKISGVYHMLSGTYALKNSGSSSTVNEVKEILANNKVGQGYFSLNPENSPAFVISGRETLKLDGTDFDSTDNNVSNGSQIIIEVSPGLDSIPLESSGLKVYALSCDKNGQVENDTKIYPKTELQKNGTSYKFIVPVSNASEKVLEGSPCFEIGKCYIFGVEGKDQSGNKITGKDGGTYGICFSSSGSAPRLSINEPDKTIVYSKKGESQKISGSAIVEEGYPKVVIKKGETTVFTKTFTESDKGEIVTGGTKYEFEYTPEYTAEGEYAFTITSSVGSLESTATRTVMYDLEGPEIGINSLTPTAQKYITDSASDPYFKDGYLNGDVTLTTSITDSFDIVNKGTDEGKEAYKPYFEIIDSTGKALEFTVGSETTASSKHYITNPVRESFVIHTSDIINKTSGDTEKEVKIKISAWDRSLNFSSLISDSYIVDQTTDNPIIISNNSNVSFDISEENQLTAKGNGALNRFVSGGQLTLRLVDDDGIDTINVQRSWSSSDLISEQHGSKEAVYTLNMPTTAGNHWFDITVKDINSVQSKTGKVWFEVTAAAPVILSISADPTYSKANGNVLNKIKINSTSYPLYLFKATEKQSAAQESGYTPASNNLPDSIDENSLSSTSLYTYVGKYGTADDGVTGDFIVGSDYILKDNVTVSNESEVAYYIVYDKSFHASNVLSVTNNVDSVSPKVTLTSLPGSEDTKNSSSYTFRGTASDDESGVTSVKIKVTNGSESVEKTVTGTNNWYYSMNYFDSDWPKIFGTAESPLQGKKTVTVTAEDSTENKTSISDTFIFDTANPVLNVTSYLGSYVTGEGYTFTGTRSDSYALAENNLKIIEKKYNSSTNSYVETSSSGSFISGSEKSWTAKIPLGSQSLSNGEKYQYQFVLTDAAGNEVKSAIYETTVDTQAPQALTITSPADSTGVNAISENNYRFEGTYTESESSVNAIWYQIKEESQNKPSAVSSGSQALNDKTWEDSGWTKGSAGTSSFNFYQAFTGGSSTSSALGEGSYKVYVCAVDVAGNVSSITEKAFDVDMSTPKIETTVGGEKLESSEIKVLSSTKDFGLVYYITETYGFAENNPVLLVKKNGNELSENDYKVTSPGPDSKGKTTYTVLITSPEDDLYTYEISATDKSGKTSSATRNIRLDTSAPELTIVTPDVTENTYQSKASITVKGSAEDSTGTSAVYYRLSDTNTLPQTPVSGTEALKEDVWTGKGWTKADGTTSWSFPITGTEGSEKYLYVAAVDTNGNATLQSGLSTGFIKVDTANPVSTSDVSTIITNSTVTLTGSVWDLNGIKSVTISQTGRAEATYSTSSEEETNPSITTGSSLAAAVSDAAKSTWTKTFNITSTRANGSATNELSDGTYTFTITVTDNAGKTNVKTKEVTIDTQKPGLSSDAIKVTNADSQKAEVGSSSETWYKTRTIIIQANPQDNANGSGIDSISYSTIAYSEGVNRNWIDLTKETVDGNLAYKGNVSFDDDGAARTVYFRVRDNAGNVIGENDNSVYRSYNIDTTGPASLNVYDENGNQITGEILTNGRSDYTIYAETSDALTGIKSVNIGDSYNAASAVTNVESSGINSGRYKIVIPPASQTGNLNIIVCDGSGNKSTFTPFTFTLDNQAPEIILNSPSAKQISQGLYGTIGVSGSVKDKRTASSTTVDGQLSSINVYYSLKESSVTSEYISTQPLDWPADYYSDSDLTSAAPEAFSSGTYYKASDWLQFSKDDDSVETSNTKDTFASTHKLSSPDKLIDISSGALTLSDNTNDRTKPVWIKIVAQDKAGNIKTLAKKITIDRDLDRPEIQLSSVMLKNTSFSADMSESARANSSSRTIYGNVVDTDGVSKFEYKIEDAYTSTTSTELDWKEVALSGGGFTLTLPSDGKKNIYFRVTDSNDGVFTTQTSNSYSLTSPKLKDAESNISTYGYSDSATKSTVVYLMVDTSDPSVLSTAFRRLSTDEWSLDSISTQTFGGPASEKKNTFYLHQYAYDKNGIASVKAEIKSKDGDSTGLTYTSRLSESGNTTVNNGNTYAEYVTPLAFDVTGMETGSRKLVLTVTDISGRFTQTEFDLVIDNTAPSITINGPSSDTTSSGSITAYGTTEGASKVYYAISTMGYDSSNGTSYSPDGNAAVSSWTDSTGKSTAITNIRTLKDGDGNPYYQYKEISDASISWFVYFDNDNSASGTHVQKMNDYLVQYGITDNLEKFESIVNLYVWIKAVDSVGNVKETCKLLQLDPQGDRPTISYTYPSVNGSTLGGEIKIYGSVNDPAAILQANLGVKQVWVQMISTGHQLSSYTGGTNFGKYAKDDSSKAITSFSPTQNDLDYLKAAGYTLYNVKTFDYSNSASNTPYNGSLDGYSPSDFAVPATLSSTSWSLSVNANKEFDNGSSINGVALRVFAVDGDGKTSINADRYVEFDASNPVLSNLYLIQSSTNKIASATDFNALASKEYSDDMFVKGEWYLIGTLTDDDSIKSLKINNSSLIKNGVEVENSSWDVLSADSAGSKTMTDEDNGTLEVTNNCYKTWYFKYKLSTASGVGSLSFNINAVDLATPTPGSTTRSISVNYDNQAPELANTEDSAYNIQPSVKQDNGFYSFGSKVSEPTVGTSSQSGLDYIAFFFMRRNIADSTEKDTIYNPMLRSGNSTAISTSVSEISGSEADGTIVYDSGLYWKAKNVTRNASTLNVLNVSTDSNVRVNGLVKIGGVNYKITDKTDSSVTINGNPEASFTIAYFAYAMLVDHTVSENGGSQVYDSKGANPGYPVSIANDDGDGMVEYIKTSGSNYTWTCDVVSRNIPDGPIEIHYVAFDQAGNYSIGIMGNWKKDDFVSSSYKAQTIDRKKFAELYNGTDTSANTLYVDGASGKSFYKSALSAAVETAITRDSNLKSPAFIANNSPRLAGVKIWTDYNGNGKGADGSDSGEVTMYYYRSKSVIIGGNVAQRAGDVTSSLILSGNEYDYDSATPGTAFMTIRDQTSFTPEIVGGNGAMKYQSRVASAENLAGKSYSALTELKDANGNSITGSDMADKADYMDSTLSYVDTDTPKTKQANILFNDFTTFNNTNGLYWFDYKIWDSTEGTTCGTDSLSAVMRLALYVDYFDTTKPWAKIRPFHWTKTGTRISTVEDLYNSIAWDEKGNALGHIELESDLNDEIKNISVNGTSLGLDPKVSGTIVVDGYAFDNIRLSKLYVSFETHSDLNTYKMGTSYSSSGWSTLSGNGWSMTAEDVYANSKGHLAHWMLTLDTSKITNVADLDKAVRVFAVDERGSAKDTSTISGTTITGNSSVTTEKVQTAQTSYIWSEVKSESNANEIYFTDAACTENAGTSTEDTAVVYKNIDDLTSYYKMDVVPYITALHTKNRTASGLKDNNIRAASGKYSVIKGTTGNFITVNGFNLNPSAVRLVTTNEKSSVNTSSGIEVSYNSAASPYTEFTASNNISKSGYLEVFVNGIRALNNINNNDAKGSYKFTGSDGNAQISDFKNMPNREADYSTTKNVRLTDDRYLRLFDMKNTRIKNGYYPTMIMNGDNPVFGYVDLNGMNWTYYNTSIPSGVGDFGYVDSCYQTQRAEFLADTGEVRDGNIEYMMGTISADQVGMAVDEDGKYFYTSVYNYDGAAMSVIFDSYAENHPWNNNGVCDGWGAGTGYSGYEGDYANYGNNNAISLERVNYGNGNLIGRYQNIRMVAKGNSSKADGAAIYMAYYDDNTTNKNVIFRTFKVGKTNYNVNTLEDGYYSNLKDEDTAGRVEIGSNASNYLDIGVTSGNIVVIVYYDISDSRLKLIYSDSEVTGKNTTPDNKWITSSVEFPEYTGNYVSMTIDSKDGIHIAAYDSSDSDLVYFYLPSYNATEVTKNTVDQAYAVGTWTRISVNSDDIPYIAYYNTTETGSREPIKLAWADSKGSDVQPGVDEDGYTTGHWEYMTVPAVNPPQGGDAKFKNVNLGFDSQGRPVVGYLGTNIEFGKALDE